MDQKGQASIDLLFATLLILIIATSLITVASKGMDSANSAEFAQAKVLADNVSRAIDSVYSAGNGQYEVFTFPEDPNFNYTVTISNNSVNVAYMGKVSTSPIIPNYGSSTINPGETYNISNNNDQIQFNKL